MNFSSFDDYTQLCTTVAERIAAILSKKPDSLICIAAGHSSLGVFDALISMFRNGNIDFSKSYFVAMDEWKGMNDTTDGSCSDFLRKNFLSHVNYPEDHIRLVNGLAEDLDQECAEIKSFIDEHGGMDYLLLGVGMNGHLALNEPGVDFNESVHVTQLDEVTKNVGTKYFNDAPALTGGVTIGIADIREAKEIVLLINGERKQEILKKIMESPVTNMLPATALKEMPQASILCDKEAAKLIL